MVEVGLYDQETVKVCRAAQWECKPLQGVELHRFGASLSGKSRERSPEQVLPSAMTSKMFVMVNDRNTLTGSMGRVLVCGTMHQDVS